MRIRLSSLSRWTIGLVLVLSLAHPQAPIPAAAAAFKIVGYLPSWQGTVGELQLGKLTHVNYAFVVPSDSGDGSLQPLDNPSKLSQLVSAAHARGVMVMIAVGGWNDGNDVGFERLAGNATTRTTFVNNMVNMVSAYALDGVDIDWEYPDPGASGANYTALMNALSSAMHTRGKLLTAAVVAEGSTAGGVESAVFGYVDYLNIMSYDDGSPHASYAYAVSNLDYWQGRGLPASKTVLGVPFYARPGYFSYRQAVAANPANANVDCATVNGTYGCYNGIPTMQNKTDLLLQRGAGISFWEASMDTTDSSSLVSAIYARTLSVPGATPTPIRTPTPTGTTTLGGNLALNKPATASSIEPGTAFAANLALDGSPATRWSSSYSDPQWIRVDLGAPYSITQVKLNWEAAYGQSYQIQVSNDASTWTTIYSTTAGDGGLDDLTGLTGSGRYVRMNGTARATVWGYSLWEFEVYGDGGGGATATPTVTPTRTAVVTAAPTQTASPTPSPSPTSTGTRRRRFWFPSTSDLSMPLEDGARQFDAEREEVEAQNVAALIFNLRQP